MEFKKDGAWEGIEKGKIVFDRLEGEDPKGYEWKDKEIDLVINDLDSRYDGKGNNSQGKGNAAAGSVELRLADADYGDGKGTPAGSKRPGAREISNAISDQPKSLSNNRSLTDLVCWGNH